MFLFGLATGLTLGGCLGVVIMAALNVARDGDRALDAWRAMRDDHRWPQTPTMSDTITAKGLTVSCVVTAAPPQGDARSPGSNPCPWPPKATSGAGSARIV